MYDVPIGPREWTYTCKFGNGQVKATLRQLTTEEEESCYDVVSARKVRANASQFVRLGCVKIEGLSVGGVPVTSGAEACDTPGLVRLVTELFVEISRGSQITEDEVKN
jgi:hypothetical protein